MGEEKKESAKTNNAEAERCHSTGEEELIIGKFSRAPTSQPAMSHMGECYTSPQTAGVPRPQ